MVGKLKLNLYETIELEVNDARDILDLLVEYRDTFFTIDNEKIKLKRELIQNKIDLLRKLIFDYSQKETEK